MAHLPKGQGVFLPPFKAWLASNIPAVYDNTMTYYEELCTLIKYLQDVVIPALNHNAEAVTTIATAVEQLQKYVEDYFENLDVQEEINNKLDEMAEDGTLDNIILNYLQMNPMITFDTLADAQASEQLINGSTFKTLGKENIDDGFGAIYKVGTESTDIDLQNDLFATVIEDFGGNNYYDEITVTTNRANDTDYYIATIPLEDNDGNLIPLSVNEDATNTPLSYAQKNYTTLTVNAGLTRQNTSSQWKQGAIISNGVALHGDLCDVTPAEYYGYIGFKADRSVLNFPASATTDVMLAQGVQNAFLTFGQLITNGVKSIPEGWVESNDPRMNIGVKLDGTIIVFACDGRTDNNAGMTMDECADIMLSLGCVNAWRCDGGGSTSVVLKGSKQNRNIDSNGTADRNIHVTLNFKKQTIDEELAKAYSYIGKERQLLNKQIREDVLAETAPSYLYASEITPVSGLNEMAETDVYQTIYTTGKNRVGDYITVNRKEGSTRIESYQLNHIGVYKFSFIGQITAGTSLPHNFILRAKRLSDNSVLATNVIYKSGDGAFNISLEFGYNVTSEDGEAILFEAQGSEGMQVLRHYINIEYMGISV